MVGAETMNTGQKILAVLCLGMLIPSGNSKGWVHPPESARSPKADPGDRVFTLQVGGLVRQYLVHIPFRYDGKDPAPVVMMFHGGGGTAQGAMKETGWTVKADKEGFLVVFPEGTRPDPSRRARFRDDPQTWNDGSGRTYAGAAQRNADDVLFTNALIDDLASRFNIDIRRIYAAGFSNGASMVFRLGRELPSRIAAIAPVAGSDWTNHQPTGPSVSLLYITGTEDPLNPVDGGSMKLWRKTIGSKPSVPGQIRRWAEMLECPPEYRVVCDQDGVKGIAYGPGREESEAVLYTVQGMGHAWPGGIRMLPAFLVGKTSNKINANDLIWDFFEKHPKK